MAGRTIILENFKRGQYMSWFVTSQTARTIIVKLYDEKKEYFLGEKKSSKMEPPIAQGNAYIEGEKLELYVEAVDSEQLQIWFNNMEIRSNDMNKRVGNCFVLAGEDYIDNDYNDICVNITAWNSAN